MKKTTISISYDEEKLSAAKLYMEQKGLAFETEMEKAADTLYGKHVPANVREFIELRSGTEPVPAKPKRPKPQVQASVDETGAKESYGSPVL